MINKQLLKKATQGDIKSFSHIFESLRPRLYAHALSFLGHGREAKDAVQDTFIKAFSKIYQLKDARKFNYWIHSILRNQCRLILRDKKKMLSSGKLEEQLTAQQQIIPPLAEDLLKKQESKSCLMQNLSRLDEKKRVVVLLRFFSRHNSYKEIARILGIPVGTVRSRLSIAKKELQKDLEAGIEPQSSLLSPNHRRYQEWLREAWNDLYAGKRNRFYSLFDPKMVIRFSSGKKSRGIGRWITEWDIDLKTGVRFKPNYVISSGNISVVEGPIINPPDKPDHCPPEGSFVFFYKREKIYRSHIHYASR